VRRRFPVEVFVAPPALTGPARRSPNVGSGWYRNLILSSAIRATVGLGFELPPKTTDVVRIAGNNEQNLKSKTQRNLLNREEIMVGAKGFEPSTS
jgi:hypothetical protein